MTPEQFEREKSYQASIALARAMLGQGIIEADDFNKIERFFRDKFCPPIGLFQG
ncbi:MAG: hypothetical protein FWD16_02585 [Clostridia bacterium]|nr:hypothetical protein [Clostridia bacterium]